MENDIEKIARYCRANLNLNEDILDAEGYYSCLPLCVIDTIFSIGVRYESTEQTVKRFCNHFNIRRLSTVRYPEPSQQLSVTAFLGFYGRYGVERMAEEVYQNRQRTSTRNGILKSEAVYRVGKVLHDRKVNYLQDVQKILGNPGFEAAFQAIPGQTSGISLRYFYMLVGSEDFIKPDRMIARFLEAATHRRMSTSEMHHALIGAVKLLSVDYPSLTPRRLDHMIWRFQRQTDV